jgi:ribosomal protein S18 acetylase RimI-like enzyme
MVARSHAELPSGIAIRLARIDDLPTLCSLGAAINAIHHEAWPTVFAAPADPERDCAFWQPFVTATDTAAFIAEEGSAAVGMVTVSVATETSSLLKPLRYGRIGSVGVAGAMRNRGIGRTLVGHAESWARLHGAAEVRLNVWAFNDRAIELYRELGYDLRSVHLGKML